MVMHACLHMQYTQPKQNERVLVLAALCMCAKFSIMDMHILMLLPPVVDDVHKQ